MRPKSVTLVNCGVRRRGRWWWPLLLLGASCRAESAVTSADDCALANERRGHRACVHRVSAQDWREISTDSGGVGVIAQTKYLVPARADARISTFFLDANHELDHYAMLTEAFPERFGGMTMDDYGQAVLGGSEREFYAGPIVEYQVAGETRIYGYTAWDGQDSSQALTCTQLLALEAELAESFEPRPLMFVPLGQTQARMAAECGALTYNPGTGVPYEPYSVGEGYGYVRAYDGPEFVQAQAQSQLSWRDILVLSEAPFDITQVVSGVVSGSRQAALSHLNVRSQARGTPSCYLRDADVLLAPWAGQLVRLVCADSQWLVSPASLESAEEFWARLRPDPVAVPMPDASTTTIAELMTLPTETPQLRADAVAAYGGKGHGLAALYQRYDGPKLSGLLVPMAWYLEFMDEQTWEVDLGEGPTTLSFAQTVERWVEDPEFSSDAALRNARLGALREAMLDAAPDPQRVAELHAQIVARWGTDTAMLRFRSSSNAEDSLLFSGAGLYDSTSVCPADSVDDDALGPSLCDSSRPSEIDIERGLLRVWASLWNVAAYEERDWYGIDHRQVAMAVLVNDRTANERANVVAMTGNPTAPQDHRWLVNAQVGELDVVSGVPGVVPERSLLDVEDGQVQEIIRVGTSSEVEPDGVVLTDAQLEQLGAALAGIADAMPIDQPVAADMRVVWDTEWKVRADGTLLVKQARPMLLPELQ